MHTLLLTISLLIMQIGPNSRARQVDYIGPIQSSLNSEIQMKGNYSLFPKLLDHIRTVIKLPIVVDGAPLSKVIKIDFNGKTKDLLSLIGEEFDLSWTIGRSGCVLYVKRFNHPQELPQFYPVEMLQLAERMKRILPTVGDTQGGNISQSLTDNIAKSFSTKQIATLLSQENTADELNSMVSLPVQELSPMQRGLIQQAVLERTYGKVVDAWNYVLNIMKAIEKSNVTLDSNLAPSRITINPIHTLTLPTGDTFTINLRRP